MGSVHTCMCVAQSYVHSFLSENHSRGILLSTHTRFVIVRSVHTRASLNHSFVGSSLSENHSGGISLNNHTRVVLLPENNHTMLRLNNTTGWTLEHFVLALHSLLRHQNPLMRLLLCFQFILKRLISLQMLRSLFF